MPETKTYQVTQWAIENAASALIHASLADDPIEAWSRFRGATGHVSGSIADLQRAGYTCVHVQFHRIGHCV